jgi:hypothetical protein
MHVQAQFSKQELLQFLAEVFGMTPKGIKMHRQVCLPVRTKIGMRLSWLRAWMLHPSIITVTPVCRGSAQSVTCIVMQAAWEAEK